MTIKKYPSQAFIDLMGYQSSIFTDDELGITVGGNVQVPIIGPNGKTIGYRSVSVGELAIMEKNYDDNHPIVANIPLDMEFEFVLNTNEAVALLSVLRQTYGGEGLTNVVHLCVASLVLDIQTKRIEEFPKGSIAIKVRYETILAVITAIMAGCHFPISSLAATALNKMMSAVEEGKNS